MSVPLAAMLRRASQMAEQWFDEADGIDMFLLIENSAGEQGMAVVPDIPDDRDIKDKLDAYLRDLLREMDAVRYVIVSECWALRGKEPEDMIYTCSLRDHPNRWEIISLAAEDERETLHATREIIRPQGRKAYLGKLDIYRPDKAEGRFMGMLPSTASESRH
jgi:hypothetical protein